MPLRSFLKIFIGGLLILAVLLVVSVQFSLTNLPSNTDHYQAYQQAAKEDLGSAFSLGAGIYDWFVSLDHDDWLALLTAALAIFTGSLWFSTHLLWKATRESLQLSRDEFSATHRPELIVREVYQTWIEEEIAQEVISVTIANRGSGSCTVVESAVECVAWPDAWEKYDREVMLTKGANEIGPLKFEAGEFKTFLWKLPGERLSLFEAHYFHGVIIYADSANVRRRYVFTRFADKGTLHFRRSKNPDVEYTD